MIPDFLKEFEFNLKEYEREFVKINANPREENPLDDSLDLKDSKFLGKPFFPQNRNYPKGRDGKPMVMIAQLNFEQIPTLENFPTDGILQLFFSAKGWYDDDWQIIYHSKEELEKHPKEDFSFLNEKYYDELPIYKIHQLSFEKEVENGSSEDTQFEFLFDGKPYWDFAEGLSENQEEEFEEYFDASGHKLGGYATFTQSDPRDYDSNQREDFQILQIDVDEHIMFGDSGVGHIFISKEHLIGKDFSKAYFYWDCC